MVVPARWFTAILTIMIVTVAVAVLIPASPPVFAAGRSGSGGTVSMALQPGTEPDMIWPFSPTSFDGTTGTSDFMYLMYRPLYYLDGPTFQLDPKLSIAYPPVYSNDDRTVSVRLKSWRWSNGQSLTVQSLAFFMGLLFTETDEYWAYIPGQFPTDVTSVSYDNATNTMALHLKGPVNPIWFTYNELAEVQPLPLSWDLSGPGKPSDCASESLAVEKADCPAVYKYIHAEAGKKTDFATNPLFQDVDGPFRLSQYSAGGSQIEFVPNKLYSGPDKPKISALKEETFTSDVAEYDVLRSGGLTIGYLPFVDAPPKPTGAKVGRNPVSGYTLEPEQSWAINYLYINFNNPTTGPVERQLYFRQAIQQLIDQDTWVKVAFNGYARPQYGTVPTQPVSPYLTKYAASDPYPFSISSAKRLLTSHGWMIPKSGAATCVNPGTGKGECGAGVAKGTKLEFNVLYASGVEALTEEMETFETDAASVGITLNLRSEPVDSIFAIDEPCTPKQASCSWQIINFGGPFTEVPDWYPENGIGFICGSLANTQNYCSTALDDLYDKVYSVSGNKYLQDVENFETQQAVVPAVPVQDYQLTEVSDHLGGYVQSGTLALEPEDWYFKS